MVGVVEIVDVRPVRWRRGLGGLRSQVRLDGGALAGRRGPEHEQVEVMALDVGAELDGFERAILSDDLDRRFHLLHGFDAEASGRTSPAELVYGYFMIGWFLNGGFAAFLFRHRLVW